MMLNSRKRTKKNALNEGENEEKCEHFQEITVKKKVSGITKKRGRPSKIDQKACEENKSGTNKENPEISKYIIKGTSKNDEVDDDSDGSPKKGDEVRGKRVRRPSKKLVESLEAEIIENKKSSPLDRKTKTSTNEEESAVKRRGRPSVKKLNESSAADEVDDDEENGETHVTIKRKGRPQKNAESDVIVPTTEEALTNVGTNQSVGVHIDDSLVKRKGSMRANEDLDKTNVSVDQPLSTFGVYALKHEVVERRGRPSIIKATCNVEDTEVENTETIDQPTGDKKRLCSKLEDRFDESLYPGIDEQEAHENKVSIKRKGRHSKKAITTNIYSIIGDINFQSGDTVTRKGRPSKQSRSLEMNHTSDNNNDETIEHPVKHKVQPSKKAVKGDNEEQIDNSNSIIENSDDTENLATDNVEEEKQVPLKRKGRPSKKANKSKELDEVENSHSDERKTQKVEEETVDSNSAKENHDEAQNLGTDNYVEEETKVPLKRRGRPSKKANKSKELDEVENSHTFEGRQTQKFGEETNDSNTMKENIDETQNLATDDNVEETKKIPLKRKGRPSKKAGNSNAVDDLEVSNTDEKKTQKVEEETDDSNAAKENHDEAQNLATDDNVEEIGKIPLKRRRHPSKKWVNSNAVEDREISNTYGWKSQKVEEKTDDPIAAKENIDSIQNLADNVEEEKKVPLKRRGRPSKKAVNSYKVEGVENSNTEEERFTQKVEDSAKRKGGPSKKVSISAITAGNHLESFDRSKENIKDDELDVETVQDEPPVKRRGRPSKKAVEQLENEIEDSKVHRKGRLSSKQTFPSAEEDEICEPPIKKKGRRSKKNLEDGINDETDNVVSEILNLNYLNEDEMPTPTINKGGRPKRIIKEEIEGKVSNEEPPKNENLENVVPARRFRKSVTVSQYTSDGEELTDRKIPGRKAKKSFPKAKNPKENDNLKYDIRLDYNTKLTHPQKIVECAICSEKMTAVVYQKEHMIKHNWLCWLTGEDPIDLNCPIIVDRILCRVKINFPKCSFVCPLCGEAKKSGRGYISHTQFCGKTQEEKIKMLVSCKLCGRTMMPSSMDSHMYICHPKTEEVILEPNSTRKAAEKCLQSMDRFKDDQDSKKSDSDCESEDDPKLLYSSNKPNQKEYIDEWKEAATRQEQLNCRTPNCNFKAEKFRKMMRHFRRCSSHTQMFNCKECEYETKSEKDIVAHVKKNHSLKVVYNREANQVLKEEKFTNALPYIPFLKCSEKVMKHSRVGTRMFTPALELTKQQRMIHYSKEPLFPNLNIEHEEWMLKTKGECSNYFHEINKSTWLRYNDQDSIFQLDAYDCRIMEDNVTILFTGGPVFGLGFAPVDGIQYLATTAHLSMTHCYQLASTGSTPGNIQIWSMGKLSNEESSSFEGAKLEYIVCHDEGGCWNIEWCPSGCHNDNRLGLIALATSSGSIPIFALPSVEYINTSSDSKSFPRIYKPKAVLRLILGTNEEQQCSRISWSKVKPHRTIVGGFVNGLIAVWDLLTESPLLRRGTNLYPFKTFQGHHSIISGLVLSPVSDNHLVSSSYDKTIKFWDLEDTTMPLVTHRKVLITDVCWLQHWMTYAAGVDSIYSSGETTLTINSIRDFIYEPHTFQTGVDSVTMSVSASDWLNCVASCHDSGQVNLSFGRRQPTINYDDRKRYIKVLIESNLFDMEKPYQNIVTGINPISCPDINDCNAYDQATNKYGIHFNVDCNMGTKAARKESNSTPVDVYPLISANRVCWNTNENAFLTLAVGYQSGFVIVSKLLPLTHDQLQINKLNNSSST